MKKHLFFVFVLFLIFSTTVRAQVNVNETNFPDSVFRAYISEKFDKDNNGVLNNAEILAIDTIVLGSTNFNISYHIASIKGIEHFSSLRCLHIRRTGWWPDITSLDVSKNTELRDLDCSCNLITNLDLRKNTKLEKLDCSQTAITSLDVSKNTALTYLECWGTQITDLDVSQNTALKWLACSKTGITSLDVSKNKALWLLYCNTTQITSLDVSQNTALEHLICAETDLKSLDVSHNTALKYLHCSFTPIRNLDLSKNTALDVLFCQDMPITSLDVSKNTALRILDCENTPITSLDVSKNTALRRLDCDNTRIKSLDVSKNTVLEDLWCSGSRLTGIDLSKNSELESFSCTESIREIKASVGEQFNLSTLPNFDISRASNFVGGTIEGSILTFNQDTVTYEYETRYPGEDPDIPATVTFTLVADPDLDEEHQSPEQEGVVPVAVNETTFPDEAFKEFILDNFDKDHDGVLSVEEIWDIVLIGLQNFRENAKAGEIEDGINVPLDSTIRDLSGIEKFVNLQVLNCAGTDLRGSLDLSKNRKLRYLDCSYTHITSLNLVNDTDLVELRAYSTNLTSLDLSDNKNLEKITWGAAQRSVELEKGNTFNTEELPWFNEERATVTSGGELNGSVLTFTDEDVYYTYATRYKGSYDIPKNLKFILTATNYKAETGNGGNDGNEGGNGGGNGNGSGEETDNETFTPSGSELSAVRIYPNPSNGLFTVEVGGIAQAEVYTAAGQQIALYSYTAAGRYNIDLRGATPGLYYLRLTTANGATQTLKLIVK